MPRRDLMPAAADELSPEMAALTPMQRAFVVAKVHYGLKNGPALRAAGSASKDPKDDGWRLAHHPAVQAAILAESRKLMRAEGPRSILTLVKIRDAEEVNPRERIRAATELLNRSGFHVVTEHHEHQHDHRSEAEMDRRILALCAELGLNPEEARKLLIAPSDFEKNAAGVWEQPEAEPAPPSKHAVECKESRARYRGMTPEHKAMAMAERRAEQAERQRQEYAEARRQRAAALDLAADDAGLDELDADPGAMPAEGAG